SCTARVSTSSYLSRTLTVTTKGAPGAPLGGLTSGRSRLSGGASRAAAAASPVAAILCASILSGSAGSALAGLRVFMNSNTVWISSALPVTVRETSRHGTATTEAAITAQQRVRRDNDGISTASSYSAIWPGVQVTGSATRDWDTAFGVAYPQTSGA